MLSFLLFEFCIYSFEFCFGGTHIILKKSQEAFVYLFFHRAWGISGCSESVRDIGDILLFPVIGFIVSFEI